MFTEHCEGVQGGAGGHLEGHRTAIMNRSALAALTGRYYVPHNGPFNQGRFARVCDRILWSRGDWWRGLWILWHRKNKIE